MHGHHHGLRFQNTGPDNGCYRSFEVSSTGDLAKLGYHNEFFCVAPEKFLAAYNDRIIELIKLAVAGTDSA